MVIMINKFIALIVCVTLISTSFCFAEHKSIKSKNDYSASISSSTQANIVAKDEQINNAISTLNYKLELVQSRYVSLSNQVDELSKRKTITENGNQSLNEPITIADLQSEIKLIRSDLAQIKEDTSLAKINLSGEQCDDEAESENKWYESKWVAPCAFALSIIALVFALGK